MKKVIENCLLLILFGALCCAGPAARADQPQNPLGLAQSIGIAIKNNPGFKAARAKVEEAYYTYKSAASYQPLTLAGNYNNGTNPNSTTNGTPEDLYLILSQNFGPIGSVQLAGKAAFHAYQSAAATYGENKITLTQNVKDAFYSLLAAQEQLKAAVENLNLARDLYGLVEKQFNAGAVPQTDLINARIQEATAEQTLIQAEGTQKLAEAALNALLAYPPARSTTVTGSLELAPLNADVSSLIQAAESERPAVKEARENLAQAQTSVSLARSQFYPSPSLFFQQDITNTSLYMGGVSLQFPLFDYGQLGNQVHVQEKTVNENENDLKQTLIQIDSSVKSGFDAYQAAYKNASTYLTDVLNPSEKLMKMTEFGYRQGALPYLQVLVAQQNLRNARFQYISLQLAGDQSMDALEAAVGKSLGGEKQ